MKRLGHGLFVIDIDAWVRAHMVGTLGGFVMMVIMGVAMVLLPMFSLSHGYSQKWIESAFYFHTIGILAVMICLISGYERFCILIIAVYYFCFIAFVIQVVVILKSLRAKQNDYWVKNSVLLFWVDMHPRGSVVQPFLSRRCSSFLAFVPLVVGHIYKILPF